MNRFRNLLSKHSQKLAFTCALGTVTLAYYLQPHYEAFTRWSTARFDVEWEEIPNLRIRSSSEEVLTDFTVTNQQRKQLNIFLTSLDESIVLGSLAKPGYAFVGLPYFFKYSRASEIPLDTLEFYRSYFPYGPYSPIGQQSMELMIVPDLAVKFLIAREVVRLCGSCNFLNLTARGQSAFSLISSVSIFYTCYQVIYKLNRELNLFARTSLGVRSVLYILSFVFGILLQYQFTTALQRHTCFRVDEIVANKNDSYRQGALLYYDWRIRWNRFWGERLSEYRGKQKKVKSNGEIVNNYDPVSHYQSEHSETNTASENVDVNQDYYFPPNESSKQSHVIESSGILKYYRGSRFQPESGQEMWAGDGDGIGFGLIGVLTMGKLPSFVTLLFGLLSYPATSQSRYARLKNN